MKNAISWLIILIIIIASVIWLFYLAKINLNMPIEPGTIVLIQPGYGVGEIALDLEKNKIVKSAFFFKLHAKLSGNQSNLQAGEYLLEKDISIKKLVDLLASGRSLSNEIPVLIKEGMSIKDINKQLKDEGIFANDDFLNLVQTKIKNLPEELDDYEFLKQAPSNADLEGYLFPDTYRIYKDSVSQDLVIKMLDNFQEKVDNDILKDIEKQGTLHEIITMASLLEKEVRTEEDMKVVSGIFWNRIDNSQPLQSCATLAYILGINKPQYSIEDTEVDSPYNTYKNYGLPPGPISNPGRTAIKAAVYPLKTSYNYFLSKPDTGETVFSKTFEEHSKNKEKYLR